MGASGVINIKGRGLFIPVSLVCGFHGFLFFVWAVYYFEWRFFIVIIGSFVHFRLLLLSVLLSYHLDCYETTVTLGMWPYNFIHQLLRFFTNSFRTKPKSGSQWYSWQCFENDNKLIITLKAMLNYMCGKLMI